MYTCDVYIYTYIYIKNANTYYIDSNDGHNHSNTENNIRGNSSDHVESMLLITVVRECWRLLVLKGALSNMFGLCLVGFS